jgi:uncharacterized iron-regulated membrane protein
MAGSALALPLQIVMTLAGLGFALLGSLAVVTFWRAQRPRRSAPAMRSERVTSG